MEAKRTLTLLLFMCFVWHATAIVNCTAIGAEGRFADPEDSTCRNYTLCIYYPFTGGYYLSYQYVCPSTSLFNPNTNKCTADYVCQTITTTETITTTPPPSVCTDDGFIPDPSSKNCSTFIECVNVGGTFIETIYSCDEGMPYNPNTTLCDPSYTCPEVVEEFSCTAPGRFPDPTDVTCQSYHMCVEATNGTFVQYDYKCPSTSLFSVTDKKCTTNYQCI